jgi:hypothetical protein
MIKRLDLRRKFGTHRVFYPLRPGKRGNRRLGNLEFQPPGYRFRDVSGVDLIDEALRDDYHFRAHGTHGTSTRGSRVMRNI